MGRWLIEAPGEDAAAETDLIRRLMERVCAADPDVIASIRARRVDHAARQHDRAQRRIRTAVEHHLDVHRRGRQDVPHGVGGAA